MFEVIIPLLHYSASCSTVTSTLGLIWKIMLHNISEISLHTDIMHMKIIDIGNRTLLSKNKIIKTLNLFLRTTHTTYASIFHQRK